MRSTRRVPAKPGRVPARLWRGRGWRWRGALLVSLALGCAGPGEPPPEMVPVPAGPFAMGCEPGVDPLCRPDIRPWELPQHTVTLSAYEIDRLEVTLAQFQACVDAAVCGPPAIVQDPTRFPDHPVAHVSWMDADAYCGRLGKRLPTEAEWEKAARGTDARIYPWGNEPPDCEKARSIYCPEAKTDPVGSHPAGVSPYGAQDMAGNVAEWTNDWGDETYYQTSPDTDPQGPATGTFKIVRGGSYFSGDATLHVTARLAETNAPAIGFRCARTTP